GKGIQLYTSNATVTGTYDAARSVKLSPVRATSISDGTSNTIAIAEKSYNAKCPTRVPSTAWDWWELPGWAHGADWPNMRLGGTWLPPVSDTQDRLNWQYPNNQIGVCPSNEFGFGSAHSGVFLAVFGDGSVKSLSLSIGNSGNSGYSDNTSILY